MLLELAKPVTLLASMLSLLAVLHTAFFGSESDFQQRIYDSIAMLVLAAGISLISGLVFLEGGPEGGHENRHEAAHGPRGRLVRVTETFPMQVFFWTAGIMLVIFLVAWYLETHCIFYRDVRY